MKKKLFVSVLVWLSLFLNSLYAQKEYNIWYFGDQAGLDFNSGSPVVLTNGMLYSEEGCSSISDANGNLLFYTAGYYVWDKNHNQMPNGSGLFGEVHITQTALIVPFPASTTMYYIFTLFPGNPFKLYYSIVDMTLNGGNGDVTIKNILLKGKISEKLCGVKHSNNTDAWIMVHSFPGDTLFAYSVTGSGVSSTPVINKIGHALSSNDYKGYMKFSADGTKLAFAANNNYVDLFDFDASTGIVSNEKYLTLPSTGLGAYGIEFSLTGHYLYATATISSYVFQWDISSNNEVIINSTLVQIGNPFISARALQMGPDGKIYVAQSIMSYIGVFNYPDSAGVSCDYINNVFSLSPGSCFYGLPNFISSGFLTTGMQSNDAQENQLEISPNPATDKITISFPATASENITIKIYSITGEVVYEKLFQSFRTLEKLNAAIDVKDFSNGLYFLSVQTGREVIPKKIVVNH